jgi:UDP-N-acetylmuramoyl-tripeptide--D-alanyl-D-alanine ligase
MQISTLKKLACFLGKTIAQDGVITGFSVDSRLIQPGMVYCALRGEKVDGHQFIDEAFKRGASACIVDQPCAADGNVILVDDVLTTIQNLAERLVATQKIRVVAVTGSVGKTTVKEFIAQLLTGSYEVFKTPGNANSQIGLPLALLNGLKDSHEIAVVEMGMSHEGEIAKLVKIAPPEVALINSVGYCHAEFFSGLSAIAKAKAEIFSNPLTKHKIFHWSLEAFLPQIVHEGGLAFGLENAGLAYSFIHHQSRWMFKELSRMHSLPTQPFQSSHLQHNLLAALSAISALNIDLSPILARIGSLKSPEKRFQIVEKDDVILINDSYNACPLSMKAALKALPEPIKSGRRIAVLGTMAELGRFSDACHREVGAFAKDHADYLICYGKDCAPLAEEWKKSGKSVELYEDFSSLAEAVKRVVKPHDVLLLKGSNSNQLWKLMDEFEK